MKEKRETLQIYYKNTINRIRRGDEANERARWKRHEENTKRNNMSKRD